MRILIIEDDPSIRQTLQDILEINGYSVVSAGTVTDGIELARTRPDFIFCDIGLPDGDGYAVLDSVQKRPECRDIPFVFLTARVDRSDQRHGMSLGADDYITKPFTERDILDSIRARINRQLPLRERIGELMEEHARMTRAEWAHELMTPISSVLAGLELLEGGGLDPVESAEILGLIRAGAERQHRLSSKIIRYIELDRLSHNPSRRPPDRCQATDAIRRGVAAAEKEVHQPGAIELQLEASEIAEDARRVANAVTEIVTNALTFTPKGTAVTVTGERHGRSYRIRVADHGPGLNAAEKDQVGPFTQFNRAEREQQGLGLGISIARMTTELSGGTFLLEDTPGGKGLTVAMDFPVPPPS